MSYVAGMSSVLDQIGQIQATFSSSPTTSGGGAFDAIMQQVSAMSSFAGAGSPPSSSASGTDLSGTYGWALEEGTALTPAERAALSGPDVAEASGTGGDEPTGSSPAQSSSTTTASAGTPIESTELSTGDALTSSGLGSTALMSSVSPSSVSSSSALTAATPSAGTSSTAGTSLGAAVAADAQKYLGVPYQWGGTNPATGVDCSGLVQDVFNDVGISLPRTADEQSQVGQAVGSMADAQPGDLLFFPGADGTAAAPGHVGIFIGNGQMVDAPYTGADVRVDPVASVGTPTEIRRITESSSEAPATGAGATYASDFAQAGATYGVPAQLLSAVANTESGYDPDAESTVGAQGLMQLMPATASSLGVNPYDPAQAINGAAQLLSSYHSQLGSWSLALAAYNAGPEAVQQYGGIPPYAQTQSYVQKVLTTAGMETQ